MATTVPVVTSLSDATSVWAGSVGLAISELQGALVTINAQTGTAYTLAAADAGKLVTLSNATAITLTVAADATVDFPIGTQIHLVQMGAGRVTVAGSGTTVNATPSLQFRTQYSSATLIKLAANSWVLIGDLLQT